MRHMRIAIIGDTHIPSRVRRLPTWIRDEIVRSDHTIHTGDIGSVEAYESIASLADGHLTAVRGDKDPDSLDLPAVATVRLNGKQFVVRHRSDMSDHHGVIQETVINLADKDAIGVTGHTHCPANDMVDGIRTLNPGSATGAPPAEDVSLIIASVQNEGMDITVQRRRRSVRQHVSTLYARCRKLFTEE